MKQYGKCIKTDTILDIGACEFIIVLIRQGRFGSFPKCPLFVVSLADPKWCERQVSDLRG